MDAGSNRQVTYFNGQDEKWNLIFPLLFLIATPIGFYFGLQFRSYEAMLLYAVSQFAFLNGIHVVFTLYMIREYPELKNWFKERKLNQPSTLFLWIGIWLALFGVLFWAAVAVKSMDFWQRQVALVLFVLKAMWGTQHDIAQWRGLNVAFNQELQASSKNKKSTKLEFFERLLVRWILIGLCVTLLTFSLSHFFVPYGNLVRMVSVSVMGLLFVALIVNSFAFFNWKWNRKVIFWLRMGLYPLAIFSPIALCGVRSSHGMEYLFVMRKMRANSGAAQRSWNWILLFTMILPLVFFAFADPNILGWWASDHIPNILVSGLWAIALATLTFHFFLDAVLFRMRDLKTREAVGPLLIGQPH